MNRLLWLHVCLAMIEEPEEQNKFEQLYLTYAKGMLVLARNILQDDLLAEDAVNRVFMDLARNMAKFEQAVSPHTKSVVMQLTKYRAIDLLRQRKKQYEHQADFMEVKYMAAEEGDPAKIDLLEEALEQLPWPYQQVLLLKYFNGYHNREIAELLGYTESNVAKIVTRGKYKLRKALEEVQNL